MAAYYWQCIGFGKGVKPVISLISLDLLEPQDIIISKNVAIEEARKINSGILL